MTHAALMITYNNLDLTRAAVDSVLAQDVGEMRLHIINNGSTDGTREWLDELMESSENTSVEHHHINRSPVALINEAMPYLFDRGHSSILCVPNDVVLPGNLYRELLRWPRGIVTASQTSELPPPPFATSSATSECTPMAVALIRKWAHDALVSKDGYFLDPRFFHYASDCDMALRMASCGLRGIQLDIQYWHYCSASHRIAPPAVARRATDQADIDRAYFERKWGFRVDDPQYGQLAGDINFRGESK